MACYLLGIMPLCEPMLIFTVREIGRLLCPEGRVPSLTHWGRVTHICVSWLTIIGSDNGLSPGRRQAIIWTNDGILFIGPKGTNFSEILIGIQTFSFKKMHLKMSSAKWRPFCPGLNVLNKSNPTNQQSGKPWGETVFLCDCYLCADPPCCYNFLDCSPGAYGSLPDSEGQPDGTATSIHRAGPQAGVGTLQWVRTHHQELHPNCHRHQARVVSGEWRWWFDGLV